LFSDGFIVFTLFDSPIYAANLHHSEDLGNPEVAQAGVPSHDLVRVGLHGFF